MKFITRELSPLFISNFAVRPSKLFTGVDMNLTIVLGRRGTHKTETISILSSRYRRWNAESRDSVFATICYVPTEMCSNQASIPKAGNEFDLAILRKIRNHPSLGTRRTETGLSDVVYYHSGGRYFRKCLPDKLSNEYKELRLEQGWGAKVICLLSSSLYYWLWILLSDCYHVTKRDIEMIAAPDSLCSDKTLPSLADKLIADLWKNSTRRERIRADGTSVAEVNFSVAKSKSIIDLIDDRLAKHFDLSELERDYILNYDIAYRAVDEE